MTHPDDGRTRPVIIYIEGSATRAALMNRKAYNKSIEQGELWTLHPETGRLVPAESGGELAELGEEAGWYVARLVGEAGSAAGGNAESGDGSDPSVEGAPGATEPSSPDVARPSTANVAGPAPADVAGPAGDDILLKLQALIDRRREELPEGSYTTHLFTKGVEKIRKKTGEEAVELILAREEGELTYEAADLLYHLMVLLSAEGLSIETVLQELARRHT